MVKKCEKVKYYDELLFNYQIYNKFRSRLFNSGHDKYLVWANAEYGYGNWSKIREMLKKEPSFLFDHYFKSRSEGDLNKRLNSLIKVIKNEFKSLENGNQPIYRKN